MQHYILLIILFILYAVLFFMLLAFSTEIGIPSSNILIAVLFVSLSALFILIFSFLNKIFNIWGIKKDDFYKVKNNFLRPGSNKNKGVLANKYCIIEYNNYDFWCYDRIDNIIKWFYTANKEQQEITLGKICEILSFNTRFDTVVNVFEKMKFYGIQENPEYHCDTVILKNKSKEYKQLLINNLSVAELICLPGINMGKAYKIAKYLQKKTFKNIDNFIVFADVPKTDGNKILKLFNNEHSMKRYFK